MKKILFGTLLIVIVIAFAYYLYPKNTLIQSKSSRAATSTEDVQPGSIYVPITNILPASTTLLAHPVVNTSTGVSISLKNISFNAPNGSAELYVNQTKAGLVDLGYAGISSLSFSPDNKYFAFRVVSVEGATGLGIELYTVNLTSANIVNIQTPQTMDNYSGYKSSPTEPIIPYIGSYTWNGENLDVEFYFVTDSYSSDGKYQDFYRISPIQIWQYNLDDNKYTLLQTLSEASSLNSQ